MFTTLSTRFITLLGLGLTATQLEAHPSGHTQLDTLSLIQHWLSSPFHLGLSIATALALVLVARKIRWPATKSRRIE
jgi:hypothetical protein